MSKLRKFEIELMATTFYFGSIKARSQLDAIDKVKRLWGNECPFRFEADDELLDHVTAREVHP